MTTTLGLLKDPYELKARITPGLLVALPILVPLVAAYGVKHPALTAVLGVVGACGAVYALGSIARGRGKQLEGKLAKSWGGMPTTVILRHRDHFLDTVSKLRYHNAIRSKLGIDIPTPEQEAADPAKADDQYIGVTKRLRELTREEKNLLLKENIAYGFHRNMLAMKPVGVITSTIGLLCSLFMGTALTLNPPYAAVPGPGEFGSAAGLTFLVSLALLAAWVLYFNGEAVRRVGFAYAERLFECLDAVKAPSSARRAKSPVP